MDERTFFNLDDLSREKNTIGPLRVHVPFNCGRSMTVFDRLRLRQLEMLGAFANDYDSDENFRDSDETQVDFFDLPTASQLSEQAFLAREAQKIASEPEHSANAQVTEEPSPQETEG